MNLASPGPVAGLGRPVQIAYAVPDAVEHAHRWSRTFGAGPFFVRRHIELASVTYRGEPAVFDHTSAYGQWGDVMVELVQDHGTGPSIVRERFAPDESGLHHLAYFVDDLDAATAAAAAHGFPLAMAAATATGLRFHFLDAVAELGHVLELYERDERLAGFYERVAAAALDWDGDDPVRFL